MFLSKTTVPRGRHAQGFTLIEILIVGALIALFAGMAIFGAQQMYDENRGKAMIDETRQIGTALSFAHDALSFYPRLNLLGTTKDLLYIRSGQTVVGLIPGIDAYGFYGPGRMAPPLSIIDEKWHPFMAINEARGSKGLARIRVPDQYNIIVLWPTDTWGNPFVFYQVVSDPALMTTSNPSGLRLAQTPTEMGNFFTAVVSYGPNGVPGGQSQTGMGRNQTIPGYPDAALFVKGDLGGTEAAFTLKCATGTGAAKLGDAADTNFNDLLAKSLNSTDPNLTGMLDPGSDDIYWRF